MILYKKAQAGGKMPKADPKEGMGTPPTKGKKRLRKRDMPGTPIEGGTQRKKKLRKRNMPGTPKPLKDAPKKMQSGGDTAAAEKDKKDSEADAKYTQMVQKNERAKIDLDFKAADARLQDLIINQQIKGNPEVREIVDNHRTSKHALDSLNNVRTNEYFQHYFNR